MYVEMFILRNSNIILIIYKYYNIYNIIINNKINEYFTINII